MFRRRSAEAPELDADLPAEEAGEEVATPGRASLTPAKGRPTPKRSEAERRRRQPFAAPADRKAAATQSRDRDKADRSRKMEAMRRGESWALPAKDRGQVRALARDYVDSHRTISEFYMFLVLVLVALLFVPALRKALVLDYVMVAVLLILFTEGYLTGRRVAKLAQERYPGDSIRGVRLYAAIRSTQLRRLRMPVPRVKPGDKI